MQGQDLVATARLKYLGTSAQKTRLVVDLIRGLDVGRAVATLRHTKKAVASDIGRLLDSAVANAHQKRQDLDVDRLYVKTAFVDGGPALKRIRPAPMGRAFRVLKRTCHVTLGLAERAAGARPAAGGAAPESAAGADAARGTGPKTRRPKTRKAAGGGTRRRMSKPSRKGGGPGKARKTTTARKKGA